MANLDGEGKGKLHEKQARERLALALDFSDRSKAIDAIRETKEYFGVAKVGLELFSAYGPKIVEEVQKEGVEVFLDLKLHDIPTTVKKAAKVIGDLEVKYTTFHTCGGLDMLLAGLEGLRSSIGGDNTLGLGVTVLTSELVLDDTLLISRALLASKAHLSGLVCSGLDLSKLKSVVERDMIFVVPGVRLEGDSTNDQARVATPTFAIENGAKLLVIGRSVTSSPDMGAAARNIFERVMKAL